MSSLTRMPASSVFPQTHRVGNQDALTRAGKRLACRIELIRNEVHCGGVPDVDAVVVRHGLAKLALHVEKAVGKLGGRVGNELGPGRVQHLNGPFQGSEEDRFPALHELRDTVADDLIAAG